MNKQCKHCSAKFEVTEDDKIFYDKMSPIFNGVKHQIPNPTLCPKCRHQRRLAFRNFRNLFKVKCNACGKKTISVFPENKKVFCRDCWWSDIWDSETFGIEFDFKQDFFKQFHKLLKASPELSSTVSNCDNCDYLVFSVNGRNCYLSSRIGNSEDIYYSYTVLDHSKVCIDCVHIDGCEYCYEAIDSQDCFSSKYIQNCKNCSDVNFCFDCISCTDCFGCVNLRNKQYYFFNKQLTKEQYLKEVSKFDLGNIEDIQKILGIFNEEKIKFPKRENFNFKNENVSGNGIINCKNVLSSFDVRNLENGKFLNASENGKDQYDGDFNYFGELSLEQIALVQGNYSIFSYTTYNSNNVLYSYNTHNCSNVFGCANIKNKEYCILNKQYTKQEYEILVSKIINHMQVTGEWGEFFPVELSPFAYNETVAQEYYPMTKEECINTYSKGLFDDNVFADMRLIASLRQNQNQSISKGWKWKDQENQIPDIEKIIPADKLPTNIKDIPDDILNWAVRCKASNKPFRIIPQELQFYRSYNIPIPHLHPDERHKNRMKLRNPRKLYDRKCDKCKKNIQTTYFPNNSTVGSSEEPLGYGREIVYCESCYLEDLY